MKALLINTPSVDITQPPLGIPSIVSYVKSKSDYSILQYDLNINFFDKLLSKDTLKKTIEYLVSKNNKDVLRKVYQTLPNNISTAKKIFRDKEDFYKYDKYIFAMDTVKLAIHLINLCNESFYIDKNFNLNFKDYNFNESINTFEKCMNLFFNAEYNPIKDTLDELLDEKVKEVSPNIVGFSNVYNSQDFLSIYLASRIKKYNVRICTFLGGPAITERINLLKIDEHEKARNSYFKSIDYFVLNDGEKSVLELIKYIDKRKSYISDITNLAYYDNKLKRYVINDIMPIEDLNELPCPVFNKEDLKKYFVPEIVMPIAPTRGCYWGRCSFCCYGFFNKERSATIYREVSAKKFVEDLKFLKNEYNVDKFSFTCDAIKLKTVEKYAKAFIKNNLKINWMTDFRLERKFLDKNFVKLLADSGLKYASFGMESYSQNNLNNMNKGLSNEHFSESIINLSNNNIVVDLMLFKKFPTETKEDYKETLQFLVDNHKHIHVPVNLGEFTLLANSTIANNAEKYGVTIVEDKYNKRELFNDDVISFINKNEYSIEGDAEIERLENILFDDNFIGDRPWIGGNQDAHSLLFVSRCSQNVLKDFNNFYGAIKIVALNFMDWNNKNVI